MTVSVFATCCSAKPDSVKHDALYWHYPHNRHEAAVREGRHKLLHRFKDDRIELYDLETDVAAQKDLSLQRPKLASRLLDKLQQWQKTVGATFE